MQDLYVAAALEDEKRNECNKYDLLLVIAFYTMYYAKLASSYE